MRQGHFFKSTHLTWWFPTIVSQVPRDICAPSNCVFKNTEKVTFSKHKHNFEELKVKITNMSRFAATRHASLCRTSPRRSATSSQGRIVRWRLSLFRGDLGDDTYMSWWSVNPKTYPLKLYEDPTIHLRPLAGDSDNDDDVHTLVVTFWALLYFSNFGGPSYLITCQVDPAAELHQGAQGDLHQCQGKPQKGDSAKKSRSSSLRHL